MYCPHCGAENPEHEKECQVCGMTLPAFKKLRPKNPSEESASLAVDGKGFWRGWERFMCRFGYYMTAVIFLLVGVWYLSGWQYGIAFDGGVNLRDCFTITEYEALFRAIDALFGLYFISWAVCAIRLRRMLLERKLRAAKLTKRLYLLTLLLFLAYQLMMLIVLLPYGMDGIEDLSQLDEYPYQFLLSFAFVIILFCAVMYIKNRRFFKSESAFTK